MSWHWENGKLLGVEGPGGFPGPAAAHSQREKVWEFLEKRNIPMGRGCTLGCGILGGNGAGDPELSLSPWPLLEGTGIP